MLFEPGLLLTELLKSLNRKKYIYLNLNFIYQCREKVFAPFLFIYFLAYLSYLKYSDQQTHFYITRR